jgi:hypothetical protein
VANRKPFRVSRFEQHVEQQERSSFGMADDHYSRSTRPNGPYARQPVSPRAPQHGDDPLAELARLIGHAPASPAGARPQAGSYADPAQDRSHERPYGEADRAGWTSAPDRYPQSYDPYAQPPRYPDDYGAQSPSYGSQSSNPDSSYAAPHTPPPAYDQPGYGEAHYSDPAYRDAYGDQRYAAPGAPPYQDQGYVPPAYGETQYPAASPAQHRSDASYSVPQFASPQFDDKPFPAYDNQLYAQQPAGYAPAPGDGRYAVPPSPVVNGHAYRAAPYDDRTPPGYDAHYYPQEPYAQEAASGHEPPARRRGGMVTVLSVLALAVVGTAAAFGYRAVFAPGTARVAPPVIKADATPAKIVPAPNDSAKPIQDRVGDRAQIERIINREEQPVDVNAARASAPRVVFPGPNPIAPLPNSPIPASPTAAAPATAGASAPVSTEPKKIRTVTIRSDQPEAASAPSAAAIPGRTANAQAGVLPVDEPPARSTGRPHGAAPSASGPLSLSPTAPAQRSAPMRTAAAVEGGYVVQVTSQRSESEAQSAYAALQAKYPSLLGNRDAIFRRADLGERGVYYRAQVPFGSQSEAAEFCTSLKNAGGQCLVQRN